MKQTKDKKGIHLSSKLVEKRCVLFISPKIAHARIHCECIDKIDATGQDAMFENDDIIF